MYLVEGVVLASETLWFIKYSDIVWLLWSVSKIVFVFDNLLHCKLDDYWHISKAVGDVIRVFTFPDVVIQHSRFSLLWPWKAESFITDGQQSTLTVITPQQWHCPVQGRGQCCQRHIWPQKQSALKGTCYFHDQYGIFPTEPNLLSISTWFYWLSHLQQWLNIFLLFPWTFDL